MKSVTDDLLIYASKACAAGTMHAHALHLEFCVFSQGRRDWEACGAENRCGMSRLHAGRRLPDHPPSPKPSAQARSSQRA